MKKRGKVRHHLLTIPYLVGISMLEGDTKVHFKHCLLNFKAPLSISSADTAVFFPILESPFSHHQFLSK